MKKGCMGLMLCFSVVITGLNLWGYEVDEKQNERIGSLEQKINKISTPNLKGIKEDIKKLKSEIEALKEKPEEIVIEEKQEEKPPAAELAGSIAFDIGVFSKYIWRGWNLFDDPVYQTNVGISQDSISAGIFGNYALGDLDRLTELDFTIDFARSINIVGVNIGYIKYTFPNVPLGGLDAQASGRESAEMYIGIGVDTYASPAITAYYDFEAGDGTYVETSVSHGFEVAGIGIEPSVAVGYNDHQWRAMGSSFTNIDPGISISWAVWKLAFTGNWVYSVGLDDVNGFKDDHGWGGLNVNIEF